MAKDETRKIKDGRSSIWINEELARILPKYIDRFGGLTRAITSAIQGYDNMMRLERRTLKDMFSQQEINLMLNNALSTAYMPLTVPGAVLADTEDDVDSTFEYYEVDRKVIVEKLKSLSLSQQYALVDWLMEMRGKEDGEPED